MCGIAGFCSFKADFLEEAERWRRVLVGMRTAIAHRGRDQTGEYLQHRVGLSHTRLSIRDLAGGVQPMLRRRGEAEYGIVYNGEIYNAEELKQDLLSRGYGFETTCDTEVILCGYICTFARLAPARIAYRPYTTSSRLGRPTTDRSFPFSALMPSTLPK